MANNPFDPTEMMKAFDPEAMRKLFDPQNMLAAFQQGAGNYDLSGMMEQNKKQFEAMAEANKAAAEAYRDMMANQMAIFQEVIAPAQNMLAKGGDTEMVKAQAEKMNAAIAEGFATMKTLADNTRKSNEEAFQSFKAHVEQAVKAAKP